MKSDIAIIRDEDLEPSLFLGCIGYESRSSFYLNNNRTTLSNAEIVLFDYNCFDESNKPILSYAENRRSALAIEGATIICEFADYISTLRSKLVSSENTRICLDITSFDRKSLAELVLLLFEKSTNIGFVNFVYCPRTFQSFDVVRFDVVQSFGPVLPQFFGISDGFQKPLTLVVGAGYEYGKVVGAIDTLEPDTTYCFRPTGTDPLFDSYIDKANVEFSFLGGNDQLIHYDLNDPSTLYFSLLNLVAHEVAEGSVIMLPLGPKMFAAICLLIGRLLHPKVMVWRHSTTSLNQPDSFTDAIATGKVISLPIRFVAQS